MQAGYEADTPAPAQAPEEHKASTGALAFIFATVFLDLLGAAMLIPVLPYIVRLYNTDALTVGLLSVIYSAAQFG